MVMHSKAVQSRKGVAALEAAVVFPVLLFLLLGIIIGGMGVYRMQLVTCLAREGARYTSVHGADWQTDTGQPPLPQSQIAQSAVLPLAVGMDATQLNVSIEWINKGNGTSQPWDGSSQYVKSLDARGNYITNTVRVTVTYNWSPGLIPGFFQLQSVSELPMSN